MFIGYEVNTESSIASENSAYVLGSDQTKGFMSFVSLAVSVWHVRVYACVCVRVCLCICMCVCVVSVVMNRGISPILIYFVINLKHNFTMLRANFEGSATVIA